MRSKRRNKDGYLRKAHVWTLFLIIFLWTILPLDSILRFPWQQPHLAPKAMAWPCDASDGVDTCCRCDTAGEAVYPNKGKKEENIRGGKIALHLNCQISVCTVAALPCLKRQEDKKDTKEKRRSL